MELARRRDSSAQRRAAAAASAERAASCADDLMQKMIEDSATGSKEGSAAGALAVKNQPTENVLGGGMLDALGPVGPPLSVSPGSPPELVDGETEGKKNLEVKQIEKPPSVKSVRAVESQEERLVNQTEPVLGSVHEHGSGDVTGRGKGNGSTPERIAPGQRVTIETQSQPRVGSVVHPGNGVPVVGPGGSCERFYIGEGPTSHETNKRGEDHWHVVNPFWSQPQQREALRETYGPGFDVGALGVQQGSNASTPQKDLRNPQKESSGNGSC